MSTKEKTALEIAIEYLRNTKCTQWCSISEHHPACQQPRAAEALNKMRTASRLSTNLDLANAVTKTLEDCRKGKQFVSNYCMALVALSSVDNYQLERIIR